MGGVKNAEIGKVFHVLMTGRNGTTIDLTQYVDYIKIYESIFEKTMSGNIGLVEGYNLKRHFAINGDELVSIKFSTEGFEDDAAYETTLQSYKLSGPLSVSDTDQKYNIFLESPITLTNKNKRVALPFNDKGDVIVRKVFDRYLNSGSSKSRLFFGPAVFNKIKFIVPLWRPLKVIDYVMHRCLNAPPNSDPSYIFFQTMDGFHFTNLAHLANQPKFATYKYHPTSISGKKQEVSDDFFKIQHIDYGEMFDRLVQTEMGVFNGILISHDITKKIASRGSIYDYVTQFDKQTHVEKHKIIAGANENFTGHPLQRISYVSKSSYRHDNISDSDLYEGWVLQRQSLLNQYYSNSVVITVPGNSLLRAGQVIDLDIPAPEPMRDGKDGQDPYTSGKYIIAHIGHTVIQIEGKASYVSRIELIRDSLPIPLPDSKEVG